MFYCGPMIDRIDEILAQGSIPLYFGKVYTRVRVVGFSKSYSDEQITFFATVYGSTKSPQKISAQSVQ